MLTKASFPALVSDRLLVLAEIQASFTSEGEKFCYRKAKPYITGFGSERPPYFCRMLFGGKFHRFLFFSKEGVGYYCPCRNRILVKALQK